MEIFVYCYHILVICFAIIPTPFRESAFKPVALFDLALFGIWGMTQMWRCFYQYGIFIREEIQKYRAAKDNNEDMSEFPDCVAKASKYLTIAPFFVITYWFAWVAYIFA